MRYCNKYYKILKYSNNCSRILKYCNNLKLIGPEAWRQATNWCTREHFYYRCVQYIFGKSEKSTCFYMYFTIIKYRYGLREHNPTSTTASLFFAYVASTGKYVWARMILMVIFAPNSSMLAIKRSSSGPYYT